ncbi:MAG TPA: methyltransferase domain-containing protein [Gaiellaceae bacterium]|nr:methyltransferase domain-containing protein [Gaiellaceae bacterium]
MQVEPATVEPIADRRAAGAAREALDAVGYTERRIIELLGDDGPGADESDVPVLARRLPDGPLATAIRLLLLQLDVAEAEAQSAFGDDGARALTALGLAERRGDRLVPRARIMPVEGLLLACDPFPQGGDDPPGYVAAFTPTASWCASLTPRRNVDRALDVGTGNGAQALLAARHSGHVVATDVNPRALGYTALNAALNGFDNVETRLGSLFAPVAGETFDLITCNAPYVISPETKWQYRDGGLPADEFSARVVGGAAASLADGGYATLLVSWLAESEDDPDGRVREWIDETGCDAWVIGLSGADPLEHAATWNDHLADDPVALGQTLDEWTSYFRTLGAGWISEGAVLLHRRNGRPHDVRADEAEPDELEHAGPQIERAFAAHALLAELEHEDELLDEELLLAENVSLEERIDPATRARESRLVLDEGTFPEVDCAPAVASALAALDGVTTLREAVERLGLPRKAEADVRSDALNTLLDLLELGFVELD